MDTYYFKRALHLLMAKFRHSQIQQDPPPTLSAPRIPVAEGNGGIRERDISDPQSPVQALISAYQQIQVNDSLVLFWADKSVATELVKQEHIEQGSLTIGIPVDAISDGEWLVHYMVTSANGANLYKSLPLDIKVKTTVPGGPDPVPSTPENENLYAVRNVPDYINKDNVGAITATIPAYLNMAEGDKITLSWGGRVVRGEVGPGGANRSVDLRVPQLIIEEAGSGPVIIEYEVRDVVNNWSRWSLKTMVDVEISDDLLFAPESLDLNAVKKLDLAELGNNNARIEVLVYTGMAAGDKVTLNWEARLPTGIVIDYPQNREVLVGELGRPLLFVVPNEIAKASAMGTVVLKYTVDSDRGRHYSRRSTFEVIGQVSVLAKPHFPEATGTNLDVGNIPLDGATVIIHDYPNMANGDRVELFVYGYDGQNNPFTHYDVLYAQPGHPIEFKVKKVFFSTLVSGRLEALYRVNGESSDVLLLEVIGEVGGTLIAPSVTGAVGGDLDPDDVSNGTTVEVSQYQGKAKGDRIILKWEGLQGASLSTWQDVNDGNLTKPISFDIAYAPYIINNLDSVVDVSYEVVRAGGGNAKSHVVPLRVQRKEGGTFVEPTVLEAQPDGKTLYPFNAINGAHVRVAYVGMTAGDSIAVSYSGSSDAATYVSETQPGHAGGSVDFLVPPRVIGASQGSTVKIHYAVARNGQQPVPSRPLELKVTVLGEGRLPQPQIPEVHLPTGALDLTKFAGNATVTLAPWPLIGERQLFWIVVSGTLEAGTPTSFYLADAQAVSQGEASNGLLVTLPRNQLERLQDASALTVTAKVAFDRNRDESRARIFPALPTRLVKDGDGGVPLPKPVIEHAQNDVLDPADAPNGTTVTVSKDVLAAGDRLVTRWIGPTGQEGVDSQTDTRNISSVEADKDQQISIATSLITANLNQVVKVDYSIVNRGRDSELINLQVRSAAVTLPEPEVADAPAGTLDPIKAVAKAVVRVTYPGMLATDDIQVKWVGTNGDGTPTIAPVKGDTSGTVSVDIPASAVGANIGKDVQVSYTRTRGGQPNDSGTLVLRVGFIQSTDLETPELDHDNNGELDLNSFQGDTLLRVKPWPFIATGQRYWLEGRGTLSAGGAYEHDFRINVTVQPGEVTGGLELTVQRSELEKLKLDEPFRLTLKVNFEGVNDRSAAQGFPVREVKVIEGAGGGLPVPEVADALAGTLDPIKAVAKAVVRVTYPGMLATDDIQVKWVGTNGDGTPTIAPVKGDTSGTVSVDIPASAVGANIGKDVQVSYTRTRGGQPNDSGTLDLRVGFIQSTDLETPELDHDNNGELDLNSFQGDTLLRVKPWPFIATGQRYWLEGRGTLSVGGAYEHDFRINVTVQPGEVTGGLELTVQRSELEKLKLDEPFRLTLKVNFEGVNDRSAAQGFPVREVKVIEGAGGGLPVPEVEKATGPGKDQLDMKDFYRAEHVTVTVRQYANMKAGDTVRVRWDNPRYMYQTAIETVVAPGNLEFKIARMELIDSIGQIVPVNYTVVRGAGQPVETSDVLTLTVASQAIALPPPRYTVASRQVSVLYTDQDNGHTAQVRWVGVILRQTGTQHVVKGTPTLFTIDQLWVSENTGQTVLINYSISRGLPNEDLLFSQVLRQRL